MGFYLSQIHKEEESHKRDDKDRLKKTKTKKEEFSISQNLPLQFEYKITGYLKMALVEIFLPSFKTQKATTISTEERTYHELHLP